MYVCVLFKEGRRRQLIEKSVRETREGRSSGDRVERQGRKGSVHGSRRRKRRERGRWSGE